MEKAVSEFRYAVTGSWLKGNTHIHSTASDGGKTFGQLAELYHSAGYDFLFRTDHWVASDARSDEQAYPLLWLDGIELDGRDATGASYHVVGLGTFKGLQREMGLEQAMAAVRSQDGMLFLAHPHWMGNSFEDALRYPFDGVEVYNNVCHWLNGKSQGGPYWSTMLSRSANCLSFAVDDAHLSPGHTGWNGGWVMVNVAERTPEAILAALRTGNFYSSCGPVIESIEWDGSVVTVQCSPVQVARLVGPQWCGDRVGSLDGSLLTNAAFKVPQDWPYAYLEVEDAQGKRAWTNTLFIPNTA
jgi:hypothetical protein